jgi:hypothetical protein
MNTSFSKEEMQIASNYMKKFQHPIKEMQVTEIPSHPS